MYTLFVESRTRPRLSIITSGRIILFIFCFWSNFFIQKRKFSHFLAKQKRKTEKNFRTFLFAKTKIPTLFCKKMGFTKNISFYKSSSILRRLFLWEKSSLEHFLLEKCLFQHFFCEKNVYCSIFLWENTLFKHFFVRKNLLKHFLYENS